jgi:outer membrane protein TolC
VTVIERLFSKGQATIGDVSKVRLAASQSRIDLSESDGNLTKSWMALLQQMGETSWLDEAVVRR